MQFRFHRSHLAVTTPAFDARTDEHTIARFIESARATPNGAELLANLLPESLDLYKNRSTNETARIRGYALAAFERTGLPETAVPYVLEELESGREPYLVAAAARAVRGFSRPPSDIVPFLFAAIDNIKRRDDAVTFDRYRPHWPATSRTSAVAEIVDTFRWLGAAARTAVPQLEALARDDLQPFTTQTRRRLLSTAEHIQRDVPTSAADCCDVVSQWRRPSHIRRLWRRRHTSQLAAVVFENHEGRTARYDEWCVGKPTIVVFFYTRCDNPNKCSLTIVKLARVQQALRARGLDRHIRTLAITYDSDHDTPPLLKNYGSNRGVTFGADHQIVRIAHGADRLRKHFDLGVNFAPATVNRHRIELFVLDRDGAIAATFQRLHWDVDRVVDEATALLRSTGPGLWLPGSVGGAAGLLAMVVPKCPVCWASYLSVFGATSMAYMPDTPLVRGGLLTLVAINALAIGVRVARAISSAPPRR